MEKGEEEQRRVKVSRELIKFQKIVEKEEEDRISALPDSLLLEILSRLPSTEGAIGTGTLSKRWRHIWTLLPVLIFIHKYNTRNRTLSGFVSFIDQTLTQCRQVKLTKLLLITTCHPRFQSQFYNLIRYAISCNVEQLKIWFFNDMFMLDQNFFSCSCFTDLSLSYCIWNPSGAICWKNLRSLCILFANLNEDLIANILSGSPVLETLVLEVCYGFRRLDITSKSVKNLVFSGYKDPENYCDMIMDSIIEINAPNVLSLTIIDTFELSKLLLENVSSVVEAKLDYEKDGYDETTRKESEEEMLKGFILKLSHVKELKVGHFCCKVLSRLEAKGFDCPSNVIKLIGGVTSDSSDSDSDL